MKIPVIKRRHRYSSQEPGIPAPSYPSSGNEHSAFSLPEYETVGGTRKADLYGHILEIQRMSTEDGPGLRTTIFLKGCTLHCPWCHNPESISLQDELEWLAVHCIGCSTCIGVCSRQALEFSPDGELLIKREVCTGCGACAAACPSGAMHMIGYRETVSDMCNELLKDAAYFKHSKGGITISGGEAALQSAFVAKLAESLQSSGVPVALDTCGFCKTGDLLDAAQHVTLVLFDLKIADPKQHKEIVGGDLHVILSHLELLLEQKKRIWLRTPVIPGFTASIKNITALAEIIEGYRRCYGDQAIERWELCAFNNLCADKYMRLGKVWACKDTPLISAETMEELISAACEAGIPREFVRGTGMTR